MFTILHKSQSVNFRVYSRTRFAFAHPATGGTHRPKRRKPIHSSILGTGPRTGTNHLFIPGPTNVPEPVRRAMNVAMEDQRGPEFGALGLGILADLKRIFRTETAG